MVGFFGHEAYGILAPQPAIEQAPTALEGEVLTTQPPRNSPFTFTLDLYIPSHCVFVLKSLSHSILWEPPPLAGGAGPARSCYKLQKTLSPRTSLFHDHVSLSVFGGW